MKSEKRRSQKIFQAREGVIGGHVEFEDLNLGNTSPRGVHVFEVSGSKLCQG